MVEKEVSYNKKTVGNGKKCLYDKKKTQEQIAKQMHASLLHPPSPTSAQSSHHMVNAQTNVFK